MAGFFDADYYLAHKVTQLAKSGTLTPSGEFYTVETLKAFFDENGIDPEAHYKEYGRGENLNPNAYFNETEYLTAKKALLAESDPTWAGKSIAELRGVMESAGMSAAEHYEKYGAFEFNSKGELLNPSNAFDANAYFAAKLVELRAAGVEGTDSMTIAQVIKAFKEAGLSPISHYTAYGATEAAATNTPLVQTVPSEQRVENDPARAENVPGNYNPPTVGAASQGAAAAPVAKPADMGGKVPASVSPTVVPPSHPLPTPANPEYVAPPANLVDSNEKPIVPPSAATNGKWAAVDPADGSADLFDQNGDPSGSLPPGSLDPSDPSVPSPAPVPPVVGGGGGGGSTGPAPFHASLTTEGTHDTLTLKNHASGEITVAVNVEPSTGDVSSSPSILIQQGDNMYAFGQASPDNHSLSINASALTGAGVTVESNKAIQDFTGSAKDDHLSIALKNLTVVNVAATNHYNGGLGKDTIQVSLGTGAADVNGMFTVTDKTSGGGNGAGGKLFTLNASGSALLGDDSTAVQNFEVLRFDAKPKWQPNGAGSDSSNAVIAIDAAAVADSFTQFHFLENALVSNLAADDFVKDVSENLDITMSLDASGGTTSGVVNLVTDAKNYGHKTFINKVDAAGTATDDLSSFKTVHIAGEGNVVFNNSDSAQGITLTSSLDKITVTNGDETESKSGTLSFQGADGHADTVTIIGSGVNAIDTGKGSDTVNLADTTGVNMVWFDKTDYVDGAAGTFNAFDTVNGFTGVSKLGVSSLVGETTGTFDAPTALQATDITFSTNTGTAVNVTDKAIYSISDPAFDGATATAANLATKLFVASGNGHFLTIVIDPAGSAAVVVIYGKDSTAWMYYIDSTYDGTRGTFSADDIALVAQLDGVEASTLSILNFA